MEMAGERMIAADRATVWAALNDPEVLKACIPGCERMEKTGDNTLEAEVTQKVGPVKAKFKGAVELQDVVEAESYRIVGEGKGGAAGFAKGGAKVTLSDAEGGTQLAYEAEAKVGGKLAQLGSRLIDGFAKKMADEFFDRFKAEVEGPAEEAPAEDWPHAAPEAEDHHQATDAARELAHHMHLDPEEAAKASAEAAPLHPETDAKIEETAAKEEKKGWFARLFG
ncbi:MAG: carbon monoxide dehydrogenase subunit G [Pseudomonadota bacterium]